MATSKALGIGLISPMGATSLDEQKRLGQFFTGPQLARLLAALAMSSSAARVIDPMVGSGDMLAAAYEAGITKLLAGIEIDPVPASECVKRLTEAKADVHVVVGDSFSPATWAKLAARRWDLVITNPPYVRYQRGAHGESGRIKAPSAEQVRRGLIDLLVDGVELPPADRIVFEHVARSYSGLADLAVPAWILCASLVRIGGRLAMVVPDTWLTRDYALPVLYLLTRYFHIEVVIEDGEATWFEDALVRTTLVVARRIADRRESRASTHDHLHIRLRPAAADERSLVGAAMSGASQPERAFTELVRSQRGELSRVSLRGTEIETVGGTYYENLVAQLGSGSRWFEAVEGRKTRRRSGPHVPRQAMRLLDTARAEFRSLKSFGWEVGQGLRTGANRFFYGSCIEEGVDESLIVVDSAVYSEPIAMPNEALRMVIRRQQDAAAGSVTKGRLLFLSSYALPEDVEATRHAIGFCPYIEMPESLATYVRVAATVNVGSSEHPRFIPQLSAVVTNSRRANPHDPQRPPRFWYQLPPLVKRHVPDLFVARINHEGPRPFVNQAGVVIDANFSTLWRIQEEALAVPVLTAILRSTWVRLALESSATVLGGGALKVEATHLRRLPIPLLDDGAIDSLDKLGRDSMNGAIDLGLLDEIDSVVWKALGAPQDVDPAEILFPLVDRRSRPNARPRALKKAAESASTGS